jgi:hypothetical protein
MSGMAVPYYVIDAPGGGGKVPVIPNYVVGTDGDSILVRNFSGKVYRYPETELDLRELTPECLHGAIGETSEQWCKDTPNS